MKIKFKLLAFFLIIVQPLEIFSQHLPYENPYAFGLDVSFVKQREESGIIYYDENGINKPCLEIFKEHGYNWGRIMICNEPTANRLPQNLEYVIGAARDLKKYGYKFLLDYMFSNGWANPMVQPTPSAWVRLSHTERVKAVYSYLKKTMTAMKQAGVLPDMIQVGNEIGNGFLWPDGRISYDKDTPSNWQNFTDYLSSAIKAIHDVTKNEKEVKIMLHVDHGGDMPMTKSFCDKMIEYGVSYDVLGLSFYPWSHGTLPDLKDNMHFVAETYKKEIIVVETGYYWKESPYFKTNPGPFSETPEGQKNWLEAVNEIVTDTPNGLGKGIFWWEPTFGTRGYFNENGKVQPVINAFDKYTRPAKRADGQNRIF